MPPKRPHGPRPPRGGPPDRPREGGTPPFRAPRPTGSGRGADPGGSPGRASFGDGRPHRADDGARAGSRGERPPRAGAALGGMELRVRDPRPARGGGSHGGGPRDGDAGPRHAGPRADRRNQGGEGSRPPRLAITPRDRPGTPPDGREPVPKEGNGVVWLHGIHAVAAALANPRRRLRRLLLTAEAEAALAERVPGGIPKRVQSERVEDRTRFHTFLPEDAVHQGVALLAEPLPNVALDDALAASDGPVLLLDQVTDPRNVGAILRSAAAFGAAAVVLQDRHAPPETGALARAASGALEVVPVVREVNLARAIRHLQDRGAWVMGLAGEAKRTLSEAKPIDRRAALVLGAEGGGLRRLQRETCDELVRLPMASGIESLNVSAAAAVALYEIARDAAPDVAGSGDAEGDDE